MELTNIEEVTKFLGGVNKAVYGIDPYEKLPDFKENEAEGDEELESNDEYKGEIGAELAAEDLIMETSRT